jgi:hypothetical protein
MFLDPLLDFLDQFHGDINGLGFAADFAGQYERGMGLAALGALATRTTAAALDLHQGAGNGDAGLPDGGHSSADSLAEKVGGQAGVHID